MNTVAKEMLPRQAARVVTQQAAGKWVVLNLKTGHYYALDEVAGRIWQLCDGSRSVQQIAEVVGEEFDAEGQDVEADVAAFVSEFVGESLLV
jgi:pyrroloquinoline quinone biosynthesis protein D